MCLFKRERSSSVIHRMDVTVGHFAEPEAEAEVQALAEAREEVNNGPQGPNVPVVQGLACPFVLLHVKSPHLMVEAGACAVIHGSLAPEVAAALPDPSYRCELGGDFFKGVLVYVKCVRTHVNVEVHSVGGGGHELSVNGLEVVPTPPCTRLRYNLRIRRLVSLSISGQAFEFLAVPEGQQITALGLLSCAVMQRDRPPYLDRLRDSDRGSLSIFHAEDWAEGGPGSFPVFREAGAFLGFGLAAPSASSVKLDESMFEEGDRSDETAVLSVSIETDWGELYVRIVSYRDILCPVTVNRVCLKSLKRGEASRGFNLPCQEQVIYLSFGEREIVLVVTERARRMNIWEVFNFFDQRVKNPRPSRIAELNSVKSVRKSSAEDSPWED